MIHTSNISILKITFGKGLFLLFFLLSSLGVFAQVPVNDNCATAISITPEVVGSSCYDVSNSASDYSTTGATASTGVANPSCGAYNGGDVWFQVVVPASGALGVGAYANSGSDASIALYTGTCPNGLTEAMCNDISGQPNIDAMINDYALTPGSTVYIRYWNDLQGGVYTQGGFNMCVVDLGNICTIYAGADVTICRGQNTQLQANGGTSYSWSPATGLSNPNIANPIASPTTTTTYTLTVLAGQNVSCPAPYQDQVTVTVLQPPIPTATNNGPVCAGQVLNLASGPNGQSFYRWTGPGGYLNNNQNVNGVTPAVTGTYTVQVSGTNGCTATASTAVVVNANPIVNISPASVTICNGSSITLGAGSISPLTYTWAPGGATTQSITVSPTTLTTYSVTGISSGCSGTATASVNVNPTPTVNVIPPQTVCSGFMTTYVALASTPTGASFTWTSTATAGITGNTPSGSGDILGQTLTTTSPSPGTVTYTIIPTIGTCVGLPGTFVVTVNPSPVITATADLYVNCPNVYDSLHATSIVPGCTYVWNWPPSGTAGGANTRVRPTVTTTYTVTATAPGGCTGSATVTITVTKPIIPNQTPSICSGSLYTFTPIDGNPLGTVVPLGTTYSWSLPVVTGGISGGTSGAAQTSINQTLTNPTDVPATATYSVTPMAGPPGNCLGNIFYDSSDSKFHAYHPCTSANDMQWIQL